MFDKEYQRNQLQMKNPKIKTRLITTAISVALLFTYIFLFSLAQEKNASREVKPITETTAKEVKKTEEGMKNQIQTEVKNIEKTEKEVVHHEKHKHSGEKNNTKETKSEVK
jgi:hypothetical protein